ncbi:MAG: efflux RND transporter permease subunit, partial [Thermodesulfobacteriota bacterium]|nr:efflux RND transporter permease subunit [Thermodesulfobacteriota bacterium]
GGLFGGSKSPVEINLYGADLEELDRLSNEIIEKIKGVEGLKDIEKSLKKTKPELHIVVDRQKASRMGLSVYQIAATVETAMLGKVVSRYHETGDEYDIRLRFQKDYRQNIEDITNIKIQSPLGFALPLSQVASFTKAYGPITITRKDQDRVVTITGTDFGRNLGDIVKDVENAISSITLKDGYFYDIGGGYEDMQSSFTELSKALIVAIILIYMVMAAQFESFSQPFIVMFTLPLAYIGVIIGLGVTGKTLSVPAFMGLIILMGIVVNNGIVMIDYINQLRQKGMKKTKAIITGAGVRLRPILITSITTIAGMLPMAFSTAEGSEMRTPMAVAVSSGLLFGMLLTLFVVPAVYSVVDTISKKARSRINKIVIGEEE